MFRRKTTRPASAGQRAGGSRAGESGTAGRVSRTRRAVVLACRAAGIVLITLVLVELGLRGLGFVVATGREDGPAGDAAEYTILCIGDSWTFGLDSYSYGEALEARLNAERPGGPRYRVVRSGIPGSNSSQGLGRLARHLEEARYDLVVVLVGNNDHQNLAGSQYWRFADDPGFAARWGARARAALHSLRVYKLGRSAFLRSTGRPTLDRYFAAASEGNVAVPKGTVIALGPHRRQLEHNLGQIVELTRAHDVDLVLMTYFYFHGYEVNESILDVAAAYDVPVVNNTVLFHEQIPERERDDYYFGWHPTVKGHDFIAQNIIDTVRFE